MPTIDIQRVPHSEGRGIMPTPVFNPTKEDFEVVWSGQLQGIIPAGKSLSLPEFLAKHAAHHLAELIMKRKWKIKIAEDPALNDRPIPLNELQKMEAALLKGEAEAFSQMEAAIVPNAPAPVAGTEKIETPKEPEKTPEQREMERQADILRKRQAAAAKMREVRRAKRAIAEASIS